MSDGNRTRCDLDHAAHGECMNSGSRSRYALDDVERVLAAVKSTGSLRDAAIALGLSPASSNTTRIRRLCVANGVEAPPRLWRTGRLTDDEFFVAGVYRHGAQIKRRLIALGVPEACAICESPPTWCGRPLNLQVDHIDGVRSNNTVSNLRLVCPNCHSQTETWGNRATQPVPRCRFCKGKVSSRRSRQCIECRWAGREPRPVKPGRPRYKIDWPSDDILVESINASSRAAVARELGVDESAIRDRLRRRGLTTIDGRRRKRVSEGT